MRNDDHRALHVIDDVFQPTDGVDVQVVGRFVEQQDVRIGEQRLRQQYPQFPARCHFAHRAVVQFTGNAGSQQQFAGTGFRGVAVQFCEFAFQLGGAHVIVFGGFRVGVNGITLLLDRPQLFVAHHHGVEHGEFFVGELVLVQFTQALVGRQAHVTGGWFQGTVQNLHEGGFATAVGTDQAVTVAITEFNGNIFKQRLGTKLHGDISGREHEVILIIGGFYESAGLYAFLHKKRTMAPRNRARAE